MTVAQWWERLGLAGWAAPGLPTNAYGKGMARSDAVLVQQEIAEFGALGAPAGLGLLLAAPTIAAHGTQEQIDHYVRDIVTGRKAWCQLFSEPQAGSDLAGLQTRAVKDGDEWVVNGQKVWTSGGQYADLGMLLARTDPDVPKHQGISYFAFEMLQDGVDVRPLKEMTGHALFNEVFITDARVADSALIGGPNKGWAVANTTLMNERAGLGSGGGNAAGGGVAQPGSVMGYLGRRVGDLATPTSSAKGEPKTQQPGGALGAMRGGAALLIGLAQARGVNTDAGIRQDLARLYTLGELGRFNGLRMKAVKEQGGDIPGMPNVSKLSMSQIVRLLAGPRPAHLGACRHAARLRRRRQGRPQARHRGPPRRRRHRDGALRPGPPDLRRNGPGAAQHHRGTRAGSAQGAQQRPGDALLATAQERLAAHGSVGRGRGASRWNGWSARCAARRRSSASTTTCPPPASSTAAGASSRWRWSSAPSRTPG